MDEEGTEALGRMAVHQEEAVRMGRARGRQFASAEVVLRKRSLENGRMCGL